MPDYQRTVGFVKRRRMGGYLLESTFSDKTVRVVLGSSGPSNVVSVVVGLSDLLLLFVPELHTIVKDKDVDGSTLSLVPAQ
jgi:hypothetical protein